MVESRFAGRNLDERSILATRLETITRIVFILDASFVLTGSGSPLLDSEGSIFH